MVKQYERTGDYQFPDGEYQEHEKAATMELEGRSILGAPLAAIGGRKHDGGDYQDRAAAAAG